MVIYFLSKTSCAGQNVTLPSDAVIEQVTGCRADQVKEMQDNVTTALDHDTGAISAVRVLHLYLERLLINFEVCTNSASLFADDAYRCQTVMLEPAHKVICCRPLGCKRSRRHRKAVADNKHSWLSPQTIFP